MDAASGADGQWIADALERYLTKERWDESIGTVAATIPDSFESFARIFHRVNGNAEPVIRWAHVAASKGTCVHPEVQFHTMARASLYRHVVLDGVVQGPPDHGELDTIQLAALALILQAHTITPQDIYQAVWNGWGGFEPGTNTQSPNLAWPSDHSWCVATEIDFDSTLVGGTAELIAAVVHSPGLEALEVKPGSNLSSEGDTSNI